MKVNMVANERYSLTARIWSHSGRDVIWKWNCTQSPPRLLLRTNPDAFCSTSKFFVCSHVTFCLLVHFGFPIKDGVQNKYTSVVILGKTFYVWLDIGKDSWHCFTFVFFWTCLESSGKRVCFSYIFKSLSLKTECSDLLKVLYPAETLLHFLI